MNVVQEAAPARKPEASRDWSPAVPPGPELSPEELAPEPFYATDDISELKVFAGITWSLPARVRKVCRSALLLEIQHSLNIGTDVMITLEHRAVIFGEVLSCRAIGAVYEAGVVIRDTFQLAEDRHLSEDELPLLAAGQGMSAAEILRCRGHLLRCRRCSDQLRQIQGVLRARAKGIV